MNRLVFLAGPYHPNFSAVGYCGYRVQKCLNKEFDLSVIAFRDHPTLPIDEIYDGISVKRIETVYMRRMNTVISVASSWQGMRIFALRVWGALRRILALETIDPTLVGSYLDQLKSMTPPPRAIIPLVFPFEAVLAALAYKKIYPEVIVIPYLFDDFVESGSLHVLKVARSLKRKRHLRLERKMLVEADLILSMHPLRDHFERNFDKALLDKITFLEHPLLTCPKERPACRLTDRVRLCYTGSLIRKVREPDYLLDLLRALRVRTPIQIDFFVMGNDTSKVRSETVGNTIHIVNHGKVSKIEADLAVFNADLLINLGEAKGKQVSSKVFEYLSTGKPIIHFSYVKNDAVAEILAKYPLALCLVQDRSCFEENVNAVSEFILANRLSVMKFSDVKSIYPEADPRITSEIISDFICNSGIGTR